MTAAVCIDNPAFAIPQRYFFGKAANATSSTPFLRRRYIIH